MKTGMLHLHHYLPYLFLLVLLISIVRAFLGKIQNPKKDKLLLVTLIFAHIQLLFGLYLLINFISLAGIDMGEPANRLITVETL